MPATKAARELGIRRRTLDCRVKSAEKFDD